MPSALLQILSGPRQGQNLSLGETPQTIGREAPCDIALDGYDGVSRQYARLFYENGTWIIEDLGSTNGVRVNGQKTRRAVLQLPCRVQLGDFIADISVSTPASAKSTRPVKPRVVSARVGWGLAGVLGVGVVLVAAWALTGTTENMSSPKTSHVPAQILDPAVKPSTAVPAEPVVKSETATPRTFTPQEGRPSVQALQVAKSATIMSVTREGRSYGFGSGFLAGDAQHIITNRHVVVGNEGAGRVQDCLIFFNSGTPREVKVEIRAEQIRLAPTAVGEDDFTSDLAVIRLDQPVAATLAAPLAIGRSEELSETDTIYALGFPLGVQTLTLDDQLPSVSVKAVSVERVQRRAESTPGSGENATVLQIGGTVTHGNSGGPVINNRGEVVGVISRGTDGTGMAYAIPTTFVRALLQCDVKSPI